MNSHSDKLEPAAVLACFVNDLRVGDDGWAMLSPYGDFPGVAYTKTADGAVSRLRAVQRVTRDSATEMVNGFKSVTGRIKRFLRGVPIYVGHPDDLAVGDRWPDKTPKGTIADLEAREAGLFCRPVFTNEGLEYLETHSGVGFSARWKAMPVAESVYQPVTLVSAGLTDNPNLPVELLNEADPGATETHNNDDMDRTKLIAGLKTLGIELANEASDDQILAALPPVAERLAGAVTLANEKAALMTEKQALTTQVETLKTERDNAVSQTTNLKTEFANERKARVDLELDKAVLEGRITAAERPTWAGKLGADFTNEAPALGRLTVKLPMRTRFGNVAGRMAEIANDSPAGRFRAIVKRHVDAGKSKVDAIGIAIREAPALYEEFLNAGVADLQL